MVVRRPLTPIEAHFGEDGVDRQGVEARHLGQIHAGDPDRGARRSHAGSCLCGLSMGCRRWREGLGITINQGRQGAEDACDFLIAGRQVLLGTIRECQGWGKRADMFRSLIALQRFDNGVQTGGDARVSGRALRSAGRALQQRSHGACAGRSRLSRHGSRGAGADACGPAPCACAAYVCPSSGSDGRDGGGDCGAGRGPQEDETTAPTPIPRQLLEPATITAIRCRTPRDIFDMAGIDERDLKSRGPRGCATAASSPSRWMPSRRGEYDRLFTSRRADARHRYTRSMSGPVGHRDPRAHRPSVPQPPQQCRRHVGG